MAVVALSLTIFEGDEMSTQYKTHEECKAYHEGYAKGTIHSLFCFLPTIIMVIIYFVMVEVMK